ncbi:MAG: CPBP family intramembrane metalloprotease [Clostridia bacterium]|nr:CPBP family intramembrane metalloprotease [Clostridia bacterium]
MERQRLKRPVLVIYALIFYGIWSLFEFFISGAVSAAAGNVLIAQFIKSGIIKNLVWTLPAVFLIHFFQDDSYLRLKEMFTNRVNIFKYVPLFLAFTAYVLLAALLTRGNISASIGGDELIILLFVGITEETVFRGWLLNATVTESKKWLFILINAVMFLLIHFPSWIMSGEFANVSVISNSICVLALSVIFSLSFIKSRSIWIPVALHTYWDLLMFLFM